MCRKERSEAVSCVGSLPRAISDSSPTFRIPPRCPGEEGRPWFGCGASSRLAKAVQRERNHDRVCPCFAGSRERLECDAYGRL
ncbi:hypothetical protein MRX96_011231 [Rhipicephalus microplus]